MIISQTEAAMYAERPTPPKGKSQPNEKPASKGGFIIRTLGNPSKANTYEEGEQMNVGSEKQQCCRKNCHRCDKCCCELSKVDSNQWVYYD